MEPNEPQKKSFKDRVLAEIENKDVKAYSKAHFTFRVILLIIVAILTLIVSVFIFNFVFFSLRVSDRGSLLGFGSQGLFFFLRFFPWRFLVLDIILIAILEWLIRKFRFGYRSPILYMVLGLLAVSISLGFAIDRGTGFNDLLLHQADQHHLPPFFEEFYEGARERPIDPGVCRATIISVNGDTVIATDIDATGTAIVTIIPPPGFPTSSLKTGDTVFVAGERISTDTIRAFGIGPILPDPDDMPRL